ncbi:ecto-ADP-ribosyltransferase 5-like [Pseudophryne corroboree]|uniref:ecto-ADP-ribosyltransferase 5-like n=1 Tax=Pseudophryne corroboree TaxID=495146 RepID=UPI0030818E3C
MERCIYVCLLCCTLGTQVSGIRLSMFSNSFDDQYEGCTEEMEDEVITNLLTKEKCADAEFSSTWDQAALRWKKMRLSVPSGFRDEYGIAIMAYTNIDSHVFSNFNQAVRNYQNSFSFRYHSLHFFLTQGVKLLRSSCWGGSWTVYRGLNMTHIDPSDKGEKIRLGQFSSSSINRTVAESFGNDSFFTMSTCFGVKVKRFSYKPEQEEILIPVDEVFEMTNFTVVGSERRFVLKTTNQRCHYYNCDYLRKGGKSSHCVESGVTRITSPLSVKALLLSGFIIFTSDIL